MKGGQTIATMRHFDPGQHARLQALGMLSANRSGKLALTRTSYYRMIARPADSAPVNRRNHWSSPCIVALYLFY
jgi:hypothetical protein